MLTTFHDSTKRATGGRSRVALEFEHAQPAPDACSLKLLEAVTPRVRERQGVSAAIKGKMRRREAGRPRAVGRPPRRRESGGRGRSRRRPSAREGLSRKTASAARTCVSSSRDGGMPAAGAERARMAHHCQAATVVQPRPCSDCADETVLDGARKQRVQLDVKVDVRADGSSPAGALESPRSEVDRAIRARDPDSLAAQEVRERVTERVMGTAQSSVKQTRRGEVSVGSGLPSFAAPPWCVRARSLATLRLSWSSS